MTAQTCGLAQHATLTAGAADSVTFSGNGNTLAVTNHDAAGLIYVRWDGTTAVAGADDTYVVRPGQTKTFRGHWGPKTVLSLISSAAAAYSAEIF